MPVKLHTYNRPLTVITRIYRAVRDTIWFVLPLLLSRIGGFFAFFSVCRKHREKPTWSTMFQAIRLAYKTTLFHFRQILLPTGFLMELKYGLRVRKFCHALHESPYSCSNSGVQELTLPFLNQKLSVSPLKPTPELLRVSERISADCSSAEWIGRNRTSAPFRETTVRNSVLYRSVTIHTLYRFTLCFRYCVVHGETGSIRPSCFYTAFGCSGNQYRP